MTFRTTIVDIGVRLIGAAITLLACLMGRAQHDIKARSLPNDPGLLEWLTTIGCVTGLCVGSLILISGSRLFRRN